VFEGYAITSNLKSDWNDLFLFSTLFLKCRLTYYHCSLLCNAKQAIFVTFFSTKNLQTSVMQYVCSGQIVFSILARFLCLPLQPCEGLIVMQ